MPALCDVHITPVCIPRSSCSFFDHVLSLPPPEFTLVPCKRPSPDKATEKDFERILELEIEKDLAFMRETRSPYKRIHDRRYRRARKLRFSESAYLELNIGTSKRDKFSRQVSDPFRIISIYKEHNMVFIRRGYVVELFPGIV